MRKYLWLVLIAILIGLNNGKVLGFPYCDIIIPSIAKNEEQILIVVNNDMQPVMAFKPSAVAWIRFVPDDQVL